MIFIETKLKDAYIIDVEPSVDERGTFSRTYCRREFAQIGFDGQIVQINHSTTKRSGTVRGMHYQLPPACEIKLVRCVQGRVFDVIIDIRKGSPTFMQWQGVELSADNRRMVFIPEGFAHGFQSLSNNTALIYHHTAYYSPEHERGLRFDDPILSIEWPLPVSIASRKDRAYPLAESHFRGIEL